MYYKLDIGGLLGLHGCPERGRRRESWGIIRGGREYPGSMLTGFVETLIECNLMDLGFIGDMYTWEKCRGTNNWIQERLDRGVANQAWCDLFPDAVVKVLEVAPSDHLPLSLHLNRKVYVPKAKRFRFENVWIREKECLNVIRDSWKSTEGEDISSRIQFCCIKLEEWGGGMKHEFKLKLADCRLWLRALRTRRDGQGVHMYKTVRWEFLNLLEKQEIY